MDRVAMAGSREQVSGQYSVLSTQYSVLSGPCDGLARLARPARIIGPVFAHSGPENTENRGPTAKTPRLAREIVGPISPQKVRKLPKIEGRCAKTPCFPGVEAFSGPALRCWQN